MARKEKQGIHPLRMMEALDLLNTRIADVIMAAHTARVVADDATNADQLRLLIARTAEAADALRAAAWPDDGDE